MIQRVFHELRLTGELARKEALDVRAIALGVLALVVAMVAIVNAVWDIEFSVMEQARRHFRLSLAVVATLPIVAECFGGDERTGGAGWARPLPVSATRVFLARVLVVAAFGCIALAVADLTNLIPVHFDSVGWGGHGPLVSDRFEVWQLEAARWGSFVLALGAVAAVAIVVRHAAVALMSGIGVLGWCVISYDLNQASDVEGALWMPIMWTRLVVVPLAGNGVAILGCIAAASWAFSMRGIRDRSAARRGGVVLLGALSVATATFAMAGDPLAVDDDALYSSPAAHVRGASASDDGEAVVVWLGHSDRDPYLESVWIVDTEGTKHRRVFAPQVAGFGTLASLVDLGYAAWHDRNNRLTARYGVGGSVGMGSAPIGYIVHDRISGLTWMRGDPRLEPDEPDQSQNPARFGRLAEGSSETYEMSPHDPRWLIVRRGGRNRHLVDNETGASLRIPTISLPLWTKRGKPLLLENRYVRPEHPGRWHLMDTGGLRPIHFEYPVSGVADLDGERWLGFNGEEGTVYIFDVDGRMLVDLRPGVNE